MEVRDQLELKAVCIVAAHAILFVCVQATKVQLLISCGKLQNLLFHRLFHAGHKNSQLEGTEPLSARLHRDIT